jgi:hypothetical protein
LQASQISSALSFFRASMREIAQADIAETAYVRRYERQRAEATFAGNFTPQFVRGLSVARRLRVRRIASDRACMPLEWRIAPSIGPTGARHLA